MGAKKRFIQNPGNTAIAYYRYSSASQRDASIEQQRKAAREYADRKEYRIIKEYSDHAISGTSDERPEFRLMLSEVREIRPAYLILWKTDRLSRDRFDAVIAKATLREAGVKIVYVTGGIPDDDEATQNILEALYEAVDANYILGLRDNINRGLRDNAQNAIYNGRKTLGYKGERDKPYEIDNDTAAIVHKIYRNFISGVPLKKIADELNDSGMRSVNGKPFSINSLRCILMNRAYIGEYKWGDIVVPDGMPVLIDKATFDAAQAKFAEKSRKQRKNVGVQQENATVDYWLTGHIECGKCHEPMHGVSGTSRHGYKCYYYYCLGHRKKTCNLKNKKKGDIEAIVLYLLEELLNDGTLILAISDICYKQYLQEHTSMDETIDAYEAGLKNIRKKIENIMTAIDDGAYSKRLKERLERYEGEEQAIQDALDNARLRKDAQLKQEDIIRFFRNFSGKLGDMKQRKKLLDLLVDKIYIYDSEIVVTYFFSEDRRRLKIKETVEMIDGQKRILELLKDHKLGSDMSLEETNDFLGLDSDEDPPDFF